MSKGRYIVIEGNDGTGKSTQVEQLAIYLESVGIKSVQTHEPDGVPAASELRKIIKNGTLERDPWTNVMLFTASRRLNWIQRIQPALEQGVWVLSARNWVSTYAYQGFGEGVDVDSIVSYTKTHVSPSYLEPDATIILSLSDIKKRKERIANRGDIEHPDTFESKEDDFQQRVEQGYQVYAEKFDATTIPADGSINSIHKKILATIQPLLTNA